MTTRIGEVGEEFKLEEETTDPSPQKKNNAYIKNTVGTYQFSYVTTDQGIKRFSMS